MRIVVAGVSEPTGEALYRQLKALGHDVSAADRERAEICGEAVRKIDVGDTDSIAGLFDGAETVFSCVTLSKPDPKSSYLKVDVRGNTHLLHEAERAGVRKFVYFSALHCETAPKVPLFAARHAFEKTLAASPLEYLIVQPTWYFHDMARIFVPLTKQEKVLLVGRRKIKTNVISAEDAARFAIEHMTDPGRAILPVGGQSTYTYREIAELFFSAARKSPSIRHASPITYSLMAAEANVRGDGTFPRIVLTKWLWTHDMYTENKYGTDDFAAYVQSLFAQDRQPE